MIHHELDGVASEVADLLIRLESSHHARGWDDDPATIYRVSIESDRLRYYRIKLGTGELHPRDDLRHLADTVQTSAYAVGERLIFPSSALAHMLIANSWVNTDFTSHDERHNDPRDLADIPGSEEARFCCAIMGSRVMALHRVRGHEPLFNEVAVSDISGGMWESLKKIHAASQRVGAW